MVLQWITFTVEYRCFDQLRIAGTVPWCPCRVDHHGRLSRHVVCRHRGADAGRFSFGELQDWWITLHISRTIHRWLAHIALFVRYGCLGDHHGIPHVVPHIRHPFPRRQATWRLQWNFPTVRHRITVDGRFVHPRRHIRHGGHGKVIFFRRKVEGKYWWKIGMELISFFSVE